jgi:DNA-binding SARP family transcriptional activator/WD40 repeat protein
MVFVMEKMGASILGDQYVRTVDYRVLGPFEVLVEGVPLPLGGPKQRGVVAVLVAVAGRPVSVDSLLQATYGEDAAPTSRATLQTYVSNLRHALGDVIVRQGDSYFVDCTSSSIDAAAFEDAYRSASALSDAEDVSARLREALAMWRGHPYADIEAHGFLDGEITRLTELRVAALENRIDADLRAGRHREVIAELDALTVEHPFRENLRALHMLALYRSGRQGEALRAFGHTRAALAEGLGIDPSPDLKDLQRRILDQDRTLLAVAGPTVHRCAVVVADVDDSGWRDPAERELAFARRETELAAAAGRTDGVKLAPKGTAGYAIFSQPIHAVQAARQVVNERTRVAVDFGDLELHEDDPVGPPLARAARLVAVAHPGQALLSSDAHGALTAGGGSGWAAESLGSFDIIGLDPALHIYQLVGNGFASDFPELLIDRLPTAVPGAVERSLPGYELRSVIGIGQLGEVHRAYQPSVGREVALRIFGPGVVGDPQFVRRFETASQRVTRVEHPHVVPLLDYWREPNRAVMVSRLMTGGHLGQRIPSSGFDTADALTIFETVASGVASAHRHGVAHGRIRPQNVLFDAEDNAFVADLGVDEICTGIITFATDAYDAPERLGGALATPATDVYSLGVLLHHLLGGSPPPPDGALSLGEGAIDRVLARATDPDPRRRQSSVDDLAAELREALAVPADPTTAFVPTRNPYRGLAAFEQADADDFHGRQRAVGQMVEVLERERLLVVVGPSGIGKSSVVKAGLLPALANGALAGSEAWLVAEMVPGRSPFERLAAALGRVATVAPPDVAGELAASVRSLDDVVRQLLPDGIELVVLVDQFEELFTQTVDDRERRAFLKMIVDVASGAPGVVRLVATLRADYFDRPLGYPGVGDAIKGRTVAVGAMTDAELADAVRLPAAGVGVEIDPLLVDRITAEAAMQPGALPLVQHTMVELFAGRQSNVITLAAFDEAGGLAGAIGRRAEAIYDGFDDERRDATRHVFLRLVTVSEDRDDTRRRVRRTELDQSGISADDLQAVLDEYGRHRLLTFDRDPTSRTPTVEVAHESLLTEWERFAGWVDDARDDLLTRRRLESATHDWMSSGSDPSFLYGGGRLELAESWAASSGFELTDDEHRFVTTSRAKVDRDQAVRNRRRRVVVGVLAAALVVATVGAAIAFVQRQNADRQTAIAEEQQQEASRQAGIAEEQRRNADRQADQTRARELAGLATQAIDEDPERAILLGLAAVERTDEPSSEALTALHRAAQSARLTSTIDGVMSISMDQSRDGSLLVASRLDDSGFVVIDAATGKTVADVTTNPIDPYGLAFDPTGSIVAVTHDSGSDPSVSPVDLFDAGSGRPVGSLTGPKGFYCCTLQYDRTGRWLGTLMEDESGPHAVIWDVAAGGKPTSFDLAYDFELLEDGRSIVVLNADGLTVFDLATGEPHRQIDVPRVEYNDFEMDPTGKLGVLVSQLARRVYVVDLDTGVLRKTLELRLPIFAQFSPDGRDLAVSGDDGLIRLYDTDQFVERERLVGTSGIPSMIFFSPDGSHLVSAATGEIRTWDISRVGPPVLGNFHVSGGLLDRLVVAADESAAYATMYTNLGDLSSVHRVNRRSGRDDEVLADVRHYFSTRPLVSPDLSVVAALDDDYVTRIIKLPAGGSTRLKRCQSVRAFDRSGRVAAVDSYLLCDERGQKVAGHSRIVDLETGRTLVDLGKGFVLYASAFGPPGDDGLPRSAVVEDRDSGAVTLYELATGDARGTYVPDGWPESLAMSPDGGRLALLMDNGRLVVLDLARFVRGDDQAAAIVFDRVAHAAGSHSVDVSNSGLIATGSSLDGVRVWSPDGDLVASVPTHQADEPSFAFASGTDTLYYEDGDGVVRRFGVDQDDVVRIARAVLTRGFTEQECDQYFSGEPCPTFDP